MRIVYFGTPEMAVPPLRALHAAGHEIVLVVSRADARRGRGSTRSPSPVKAAALELSLPVTEDPADVLDVRADLGVVVAFGRIISVELLEHLPMVNLHFSLLPRWRGAAPVERAILAGDEVTGVCVMAVEEGLDTGGVFARAEVAIDDTVSAGELRERLVQRGTQLLVDTLGRGLGDAEPQSTEGVTYARKLSAEDHELHWDRPGEELLRVVRLGGAWTTFKGRRLKVLAARRPAVLGDTEAVADDDVAPGTFTSPTTVATTDGPIALLTVQPEGRPAMDASAWANGAQPLGDRLGS